MSVYLELSQWCCDTSPCINQLTLARHKRQRPLCIGARAGGGERAVSEPAPRRNGGYKENIVWCHYWYYDLRYTVLPRPPPPPPLPESTDKNRIKYNKNHSLHCTRHTHIYWTQQTDGQFCDILFGYFQLRIRCLNPRICVSEKMVSCITMV